MLGIGVVSGRKEREKNDENEPRLWSWFAFVTYHICLPLLWYPLVFLLPQLLRRAMMRYPHPTGKWRGECGLPVLAGGVVDWAHIPLERGGAPGREVACGWGGS